MVKDESYYLNTIPGRVLVWWSLTQIKIRRVPHNIAWWIAFHLPRYIVLMAFVRVAAETAKEQEDFEAYGRMYGTWERREGHY